MVMIAAYVYLLVLTSLCFVGGVLQGVEIDVSWDFELDETITPWGNATTEQRQMSTIVQSGELQCTIEGFEPTLDSPSLYLQVSDRHFVIMRIKYSGVATSARMLIRSGSNLSPEEQRIFDKSHWTGRQPMEAFYDSGAANESENYTRHAMVDNNPYTYFLSASPSVVTVRFDLGDFRYINALHMTAVGGANSPKKCIIQMSVTTGIGPWKTVSTFVAQNSTEEQVVKHFEGYARYWQLIVIDNYGGDNIGIREFYLDGYDETVRTVPIDFHNDNKFHMYYLPLSTYLSGILTGMRFEIVYNTEVTYKGRGLVGQVWREHMSVDYIRVVRAPRIFRVTGCLDKFFDNANFENPQYSVDEHIMYINGNLPVYSITKRDAYEESGGRLKYASTYDCPLQGGIPIVIEGINFGAHPVVLVGGHECPVVSNEFSAEDGREQKVTCTLPTSYSGPQSVRVTNGQHPGLLEEAWLLAYTTAPPVIPAPSITNVASRAVDLAWQGPSDPFSLNTVTGYKILWFEATKENQISNLTVGNVTVTSVRGLKPGVEYVFKIAAMSEGYANADLPTDMYCRRDPTEEALIGEFSNPTNATGTLDFDFQFSFFNANKTLNHSSATPVRSLGPTGNFGGEGSYGLIMVGSANIQNCNVSSTCCDGYNATIGVASCGDYPSVCAVLPSRMLAYDLVVDGVTRRGIPSSQMYSNGAPAEINIVTLAQLTANKGAALPSAPCGPALRLTPSKARQSGAAWYPRKMDVREGFDTQIQFEISNPSQKCDRLDDVNTYCTSRGADGWAFVMHNEGLDALGKAGSGLGYEGIKNSLVVEVDTYFNYENMDYYNNHISVQTEGFRYNISANHSRSLATTNRCPDLTNGKHIIRIRYDPNFQSNDAPHPSFTVNGHHTWFINNADFKYGGMGDWGTGFGMLYVYLDDLNSPIMTVPLNLGSTIELDNGRAYVGVTAATGNEHWQAHDINFWQFTSLYIDELYSPPILVNGQGAHQCVRNKACVHRPDSDHFMRTNNVWESP